MPVPDPNVDTLYWNADVIHAKAEGISYPDEFTYVPAEAGATEDERRRLAGGPSWRERICGAA